MFYKQCRYVSLYDLLQQDDHPLPLGGDLHDPGQHAGHLDHGKVQLILFLFLFHQSRDVQGFVVDQRERPGGIHCHGSQHRIYIVPKIPVHIFSLLLCQILVSDDNLQAVLLQLRHQGTVVGGVLKSHQVVGFLLYFFQLLFRFKTCQIRFGVACMDHIF